MANQPETNTFDAGVYQIETTDAVLGGVGGIANRSLLSLSNRTRYLLNQITAMLATIATLAGINSPTFTGSPQAPTPPIGDSSAALATTAFVQYAGQPVNVNVAGNSNVVLTAAQYGCGVIIFNGALTGNINVIFPGTGIWIVANATSGAFSLNLKTAGGTPLQVAQGYRSAVFGNGVNILRSGTDISGSAITTTPTAGDSSNLVPTTAFVTSAISTLSLGSASTHAASDFDAAGAAAAVQTASFKISNNLSEIVNPLTCRNNLGLGSASVHLATDFDAAGAAATVQANSFKISNNLSEVVNALACRNNLGLGTASVHAFGDFDPSGAAAAVAAASFAIGNDLSEVLHPLTARNNLGLGTASVHAYGDFDPSGAASSALVTAKAYTDAAVAPLQVGKGVNATPTTGTGAFQRLIRLTVTIPTGGTVLMITAFVNQAFTGGGSNSTLKITVGGTDYTPVPYLAASANPVALSQAYIFQANSGAPFTLNVDLNWLGGVNVSSSDAFLTCVGAA